MAADDRDEHTRVVQIDGVKLGDTIAILNDGSVVQQGDPQDIVMHPADDYIANFVKDINRTRVIRARSNHRIYKMQLKHSF